MKIYVIQKGEYSDRHIIGITETEDLAKKIVEATSDKYYKSFYQEFDTDQFKDARHRYIVSNWTDEWKAEYDDYDIYEYYGNDNKMISEFEFVIFAENQEQAIKIAQDMLAENKAKKAGITE